MPNLNAVSVYTKFYTPSFNSNFSFEFSNDFFNFSFHDNNYKGLFSPLTPVLKMFIL